MNIGMQVVFFLILSFCVFLDICPGVGLIDHMISQFLFFLRNLDGAGGKEPTCQWGFNPWLGEESWSRKGQPAPVFLPVKFHGQRTYKESNTTELLSTRNLHTILCSGCHTCSAL